MNNYSITEKNGCRLVTGSVPLSSFGSLCQGMPDDAIFSPHAARLLGVALAIGSPADIDSLVNDPLVIEAARLRVKDITGLSDAAKEWLATGQHGVSSTTIFQRLTGHKLSNHENHPSDASDLGRCRRLLEQVPELRPRLHELSSLSPIWERVIAEWDALGALMDSESPNWRTGSCAAAKTYKRMKDLGC